MDKTTQLIVAIVLSVIISTLVAVSLMAAGVMVPDDPHAWPLDRAADALTALEGRQTTGKLVIVP